ncbi:MAG TPA: hypothetical protein VGN59_04450 [Acidimicrobiia bacterium]
MQGRARGVVVVVGVLVALAGCKAVTGFKAIDASYTGVRITADDTSSSDAYDLVVHPGVPLAQVDLDAASENQGGNARTSFFPAGQAPAESGEVCATWSGPGKPDDARQQGNAVRVETNASGPRRAVTVTKNVWYGATWLMNVNVWTVTQASGAPDVPTLVTLANLDFSGVVGTWDDQAFPWRVCTRFTGPTVVVDVGTATTEHVPFSDPAYERSVTLPDGWDYAGQYGWYIGHLRPGTSFSYTDLTTGPVVDPPPTTTSTSSTTTTSEPSSTTTSTDPTTTTTGVPDPPPEGPPG